MSSLRATQDLIRALDEAERQLALYRKAVNKIDDAFEYAYGSKEDRKRVREILGDLCRELVAGK